MALTKIQGQNIQDYAIDTNKLSNTAVSAFAQSLAPKVTTVNVANSAYTVLDDTAVNIGGGYIVVTGSDFQSGAIVLVDTTQATSTTFVNSTTLRAELPAKSAASYNIYVVNPDGGTGIRVNGVTFSGTPTWVTSSPLSNQLANTSFNVSLSATSATSYSNTTALPAGTQLLSNGYFYGTVTIGAETTYSFTVRATDAENQDADKTFNVTVTVAPQYQLWLWGRNNFGQLGFNDIVDRSSPVQVGSGTNWNLVSIGSYNTMATKTDGTLWTWGYNIRGQLGLGDTVYRSSPVQVGSGTNWNLVNIGEYSTIATKTNGTLWTWGGNIRGQLGFNDIVHRSSPVQVGSGTNWNLVSIGTSYNTIATKTDGTLWTWGSNQRGQLGFNDIVDRSSPVQVGSGTNWNLVSIGAYNTIATKTDGTLWIWGYNNNGQLGLGNIVDRSSPVQVGSGTTWSEVSIGVYNTIATKTDGTLWIWGRNDHGQLGLNDRVYRSSPVQVGSGTTWSKVSIGKYNTIATRTA